MLQKNKLFNPEGNDTREQRKLLYGESTGIFNLNNCKYSWTKPLYHIMIGNFWVPEKVSGLGQDAIEFCNLSFHEKQCYKAILSFLIFLDSIQTQNIVHFSEYFTAPEINLLLTIHAYQEAIHSQAYSVLLETIVTSEEREEIYYFWKHDAKLLERNKFIGDIYQTFLDHPSEENFFQAIIANFLLEGIYFYNGFAFFDTLAYHMKMLATDRMIHYIRRDELTHVTLFSYIIKEIKKEFPTMYNETTILDMVHEGVKQEIEWSTHILHNHISGINATSITQYTQWLANERLRMLDIPPLFPEVHKNPYTHLEKIQNHNLEKGNFFESTIVNYTQSHCLAGSWDF